MLLLTRKLLDQWFILVNRTSSIHNKCHVRYLYERKFDEQWLSTTTPSSNNQEGGLLTGLTTPPSWPKPGPRFSPSYVLVFLCLILLEFIVRFVDIGGIVDHHCLNFLFIIYDKGGNFNTFGFTCICSNIPAAPAYGECISDLIRYWRDCVSYQNYFNIDGCYWQRKLQNQWCLVAKLKSTL